MLLCPKCGSKLEVETKIEQYPFVCKVCDENFFEFEGDKVSEAKLLENIDEQEVVELLIGSLHPGFADSVVQMDLDDGHLFGCSMTQGTMENPANNVIEIARISQNNHFDDMCVCDECKNYGCTYATKNDEKFDEEMFDDCLYEQISEAISFKNFMAHIIENEPMRK